MKVLAVRMKNISSLKGSWLVDFTHPSFSKGSAFAITGNTGAGKSSIFDSIVLSIYGETPRLGSNEYAVINNVVTTGEMESECASLIEIGDKKYISIWRFTKSRKQKRKKSAKKAKDQEVLANENQDFPIEGGDGGEQNGPFRDPNQIYEDMRLDDSEWTRSKENVVFDVSEVDEAMLNSGWSEEWSPSVGCLKDPKLWNDLANKDLIRKLPTNFTKGNIIGMDKKQFLKAVLLAQNEFSKFLDSSENEKGELLKTITGMDEFEKVGIAVYERHKKEKELLDKLEFKIAAVKLLSKEEELKIQEDLASFNGAKAEKVKEREDVANSLGKVEEHKKYLAMKGNYEKLKEDYRLAMDDWRNTQENIYLEASKADAHSKLNILCVNKAKEEEDSRRRIEDVNKALAAIASEGERLSGEFSQMSKDYELASDEAAKSSEVFMEIGKIDEVVEQRTKELATLRNELDVKAEEIGKLTEEKNSLQTKLEDLEQSVKMDKAWVDENPGAKMVRDSRDIMGYELKKLERLYDELEQNERKSFKAKENVIRLNGKIRNIREESARADKEIAEIQEKLASQKTRVGKLESLAIRENVENWSSHNNALGNMWRLMEKFGDMAAEIIWLDMNHGKLEKDISEKSAKLQNINEEMEKLGDRTRRLEEDKFALMRENDARELRKNLKEGEACPVCGSKHHPALSHGADEAGSDDVAKEEEFLRRYREKLQKIEDELAKAADENRNILKESTLVKNDIDSLKTSLADTPNKLAKLADEWNGLSEKARGEAGAIFGLGGSYGRFCREFLGSSFAQHRPARMPEGIMDKLAKQVDGQADGQTYVQDFTSEIDELVGGMDFFGKTFESQELAQALEARMKADPSNHEKAWEFFEGGMDSEFNNLVVSTILNGDWDYLSKEQDDIDAIKQWMADLERNFDEANDGLVDLEKQMSDVRNGKSMLKRDFVHTSKELVSQAKTLVEAASQRRRKRMETDIAEKTIADFVLKAEGDLKFSLTGNPKAVFPRIENLGSTETGEGVLGMLAGRLNQADAESAQIIEMAQKMETDFVEGQEPGFENEADFTQWLQGATDFFEEALKFQEKCIREEMDIQLLDIGFATIASHIREISQMWDKAMANINGAEETKREMQNQLDQLDIKANNANDEKKRIEQNEQKINGMVEEAKWGRLEQMLALKNYGAFQTLASLGDAELVGFRMDDLKRLDATYKQNKKLAMENARTRFQENINLATSRKSELHAVEKQNKEQKQKLDELEKELIAKVTEAGFRDLDDFRSKLIPEDELQSLKERWEKLKEDKIALENTAQNLAKFEEIYANFDSQALDENMLKENLRELEDAIKELDAKIAECVGALNENSKKIKDLGDIKEERDAQWSVCEDWRELKDMIGTADGSKFNKMAQRYTFRLLVSEANVYLTKIMPRYKLEANPKSEFELLVIDMYDDGIPRSCLNISGGEQFVVSLCLALGLSSLAGRKHSLGTLFLDEGFGSLDPGALMNTISCLQGIQAEGKLVGIISHVEDVKEMLGSHIMVTKNATGKSEIKGEGCYKIA